MAGEFDPMTQLYLMNQSRAQEPLTPIDKLKVPAGRGTVPAPRSNPNQAPGIKSIDDLLAGRTTAQDPETAKFLEDLRSRPTVGGDQGSQQFMSSFFGDTPEIAEQKKRMKGYIGEQEKNVKDLEGLTDYYRSNRQLDLTPLLALADAWGGTHLAQAYKKPLSPEERQEHVLKLEDKVADNKKELVNSQAKEIQSERQQDLFNAMMRQNRFEDVKQQALGKAYGPYVTDMKNALEQLEKHLPGGIDNQNLDAPVPGYGWQSFVPRQLADAQQASVRRNVTRLLNAYVYLSSGKQINENEAERLKQAVGQLNWDSPRDIRGGLQDMKRSLFSLMQQIEAGFGGGEGDTVKRFRANGGLTSQDIFNLGRKPQQPGDQAAGAEAPPKETELQRRMREAKEKVRRQREQQQEQ